MVNRLARVVLVCAIFAGIALAQSDRYVVNVEGSKTSASAVVTIQQPATGAKSVQLLSVAVQCSVTCPVFIDRDGAAAAATPATIARGNGAASAAPSTLAYSDSDVGTGTHKLTPTLNISANVIQPFSMDGIYLEGNGTGKNVSVHVGPFTGTYSVQIIFAERR